MSDPKITPVVGVACFKSDQVLLIQRGKSPYKGRWTLPGGHIEPGEKAANAALRELKEETSVKAELSGLIDIVDGIFPPRTEGDLGRHYIYVEFACRWLSGDAVAGDDAADARFFNPADLPKLDLMPDVLRIVELGRSMIDATSSSNMSE